MAFVLVFHFIHVSGFPSNGYISGKDDFSALESCFSSLVITESESESESSESEKQRFRFLFLLEVSDSVTDTVFDVSVDIGPSEVS